nr:mandelate racemase/muconate lactonizing enzyme family protein [Paenibacillus soyae]
MYYKLPEPYGDANGIKSYRTAFYIRILTDSGIDGWGECSDWLPTLQKGFEARIIPYLLGQDARERTRLVGEIAKWHKRSASAVSMALTEIFAKHSQVSVCQLWGGRMRDTIPVYASFQSYSERPNWRQVSWQAIDHALQAGFRLIKLKIGGKPVEEDQQHIAQALKLIGDQAYAALDANESYDLSTTLRWGPIIMETPSLLWLEEPMPIHQANPYRLLRQKLPIPIAGGENFKKAVQYLPLLTDNALDIATPDILHLTGLDEYWSAIRLAQSFGVRVSPHCYDGALTRLYAIFAQACLVPWNKMKPDVVDPVEWDAMDNPINGLLPIQPVHGQITVPQGHGIGVEIDREKLSAYKWDGSIYS